MISAKASNSPSFLGGFDAFVVNLVLITSFNNENNSIIWLYSIFMCNNIGCKCKQCTKFRVCREECLFTALLRMNE